MASVYSRQFFIGILPPNGTVIFTVPASQTLVLRDIELYNGSGAVGGCSIQCRVSGALQSVLFQAFELGADNWAQWQGRAVLEQGQELASGAGAPNFYAHVSGYLFGP